MVCVSDAHAPPDTATPAGRPLLSLALASMMDAVHAHSGAVYLLTPGEPVLEMAVTAGLPRQFAAPWERVGLSAPIPVADAARERRLVWVGGEQEMARRYPRIAVVLPYHFALAALPVATPTKVHGAVFVTWPGSHPPVLSGWERGRLTAACDRLALRLERASQDHGRFRGEADLLPMPDPAIAGTLGTVESARLLARLPYGLVSLDLHGRIAFANGAAAELLGRPAGELLGTQLWSSVPWLDDPVYEDRYRAALLSQHVTSFLAMRPPGTWLSFRLYPDTTGLSVRISRARSVAQLTRSAPDPGTGPGRLVSISQVLSLAGALTEAASVEDVIQLTADEIAPAVGSQALVILGSRAGRMRVLGHRGYPEPYVVEQFDGTPMSAQTPGVHALRGGAPAFFDSRDELERLYPARHAIPDGFAAWAYLPLIASGRPVGTCVLAYAERRAFPAEERAVLTNLAGLIAQALERAQLYDAKHRLAHGLQEALLPSSLPVLPGVRAAARYLPATQGMDIGGDFYDLVPAPPFAAAVIGDVQGHNVTAAGMMGQLRTAVRAYTAVGQAPARVMRSTNRLLLELGSELLASCLYVRLDPASGRAVMARAGHPPPLLLRPDGKVRVLDLAGGPLLGVAPTARYPTTEIDLAAGSLLALYTDGLVESPGTDIEDALAALGARLGECGDAPLDEVADHLLASSPAARERADDVALLLLRVGE
ncbi:SpoIIE family protein phosphatase [Streptomyces mangrovisoli]|uniref:protein-serine/threonine phosphatase n=1 Tax=Streptomyces mangrovisoli TaxID=1428628 RepID=A0A1J4P5T9_9ACTN|nr:SpoIIE family protein phosphatase [Streptomyces mangrovisoli]OIJ68885.1 PAS sensor protein [Streptomyces mangrovisoli]